MANDIDDKKIRDILSKYVSADLVDELAAQTKSENNDFEKGIINFLLLEVRDKKAENIASNVGNAVQIILANNGFVSNIMSSTVMATFGFPIVKEDGDHYRQCINTCLLIQQALGDDVRVLHCSVPGFFGNLRAGSYMSYGPVIANFSMSIRRLMDMDFGSVEEFSLD